MGFDPLHARGSNQALSCVIQGHKPADRLLDRRAFFCGEPGDSPGDKPGDSPVENPVDNLWKTWGYSGDKTARGDTTVTPEVTLLSPNLLRVTT